MSYEQPYRGIRVLDVSQGVAGPYCAMLLAQHGAEVIKIEPLEGDWARTVGPRYGDHTAFSVVANLGKRSIALDLKSEAGRAILDHLIPTADVFLEGFRPGVIDRLGLGWQRLRDLNPGLIYLSVSGFGQDGPLADKPAMDPVLQAFTGFMSENKGPDGVPHRTPVIVVDMATALFAHQAVAAALYARRDDRRGRRIEASLLQGAANLQGVRLMSSVREGGELKPGGAPAGTYPTSDGWIQMVTIKDHEFRKLCECLGFADLVEDPRYRTNADRLRHAEYLNVRVRDLLAQRPSGHWRALFTEAGLQNEVLQTYEQFVHHPHTQATGVISWLEQPGNDTPWAVPNPPGSARLQAGQQLSRAPVIGQHTAEVLAELGYSPAEIVELKEQRAVI